MITDSARASRVPVRLWLYILAGCTVAAFLDGLQTWLQGTIGDSDPAGWQRIVFQAAEWFFLAGLTLVTFYLGQRFPLRRPGLRRALAVHLAGAFFLCVGWAALGVALRRGLGDRYRPLSEDFLSWVLVSTPWSFFMYFAVLGCVHAFSYALAVRERDARTAQLEAQLSEARLNALRMQLHPHFLFNSLNAITVLVRDQSTQLAGRMLELLSDVLRQVLRRDQPHEVSVAEEVRLIEQYLAIEQIRFSDRLRVHIDVDPEVHKAVVPRFILQPLVENALRHGVADRTESAIVEIGVARRGDDLELWVRDDGPGLQPGLKPAGVGLENTRLRLTTLYGERAVLMLEAAPGGGTIARIRLPYHEAAGAVASGSDDR